MMKTPILVSSRRQQCDFAFREMLPLPLLPVLLLLQFHWKSADDVAGARGVCAMPLRSPSHKMAIALLQFAIILIYFLFVPEVEH